MRTIKKLVRRLIRTPVLPPPDRSCRRPGEVADELARHSAKLARQA